MHLIGVLRRNEEYFTATSVILGGNRVVAGENTLSSHHKLFEDHQG